jgi:hypothetical protein
MARLFWQYAPALVVWTGAVLVAFGTFWSSLRQSHFNARLAQKNQEIAELQLESANAITGGDSFAYMGVMVPDPKSAATIIPVFVHKGKYPLYDVEARIVDLEEFRRLTELKDSLAASRAIQGTALKVGNMTPGFSSTPGIVLTHLSGRDISYNIFYVARNGSWIQTLRMRWVGDGWATADRIVGGPQRKDIYRDIKSNYPLNTAGEVDWDAPLPKQAPVAGGETKETNSTSQAAESKK